MSDLAGILPKWFSNRGIIFAKGQLDHSYTFWTMANYTTVDCLSFFDSDVSNLSSALHLISISWLYYENFINSTSYWTSTHYAPVYPSLLKTLKIPFLETELLHKNRGDEIFFWWSRLFSFFPPLFSIFCCCVVVWTSERCQLSLEM